MLGNLYPTDTGTTYYQDELEYTQKIQDISGITLGTDFSKSYYMGYIPQDSFPETVFGLTMPRISDDNTTILLNNHVKENRPWGFCKLQETSGNNNVLPFQAYYFNAFNQLSRVVSSDWANIRFINKLTFANLTVKDLISLTIKFRIVPTTDIDDNGSGRAVTTVSWQNSISLLDLIDFVSGDLSFTCSISQPYVSTTKIIHYSDFDENNLTYHYTENGYDVYVQLQDFDIYSGHVYNHENNRIYDANIVPFYRTHIPDGYGYPEQDILVTGYNYLSIATDVRYEFYDTGSHDTFYPSSSPGLPITSGSYNGTLNNFNIIRGKFPIDSVIASDVPVLTGSGSGIVYNCLFIDAKSGTGGTFSFIPALDFKDVLKAAFMRNCVYCGSDQSINLLPLLTTYTSEEVVSYYNEDDIPFFDNPDLEVYEWGEQGDISLLSGLLRPWQLPDADITENEFDVEDMPEYDPSGGEGEDGDGDNILPPALSGIGDLTGFVTMYAVKADQLANLGNQLWASFTNPDFWNSVSVVLLDTTSIDPSVILNYIVSIRLFPFDLSTVSGASAELPEIFFGRGLAGVLVDTNLAHSIYTLNKCVTRVEGGVLKVPAFYGDFRDMEPCAKMILHVPFAGSCEINPSQVVGKYLALSYSIDYCTGAFMAQCFVSGDGLPMSYPVATLYGQLGATVQLSASNEMESLQCLAGAAVGLATGAMGNIAGALSGAMGVATSLSSNRAIPHTTGKSAGFSSFFEPRVPYIEIIYDKYYVADNYGHVHGYACNTVSRIGDLHGYTVCRNVDTTGLSCETDERLSIKRILESGFFVD